MGCGASVPKAGQNRPIAWVESTENPLAGIGPYKSLGELPVWICDLHNSMPSWLSQPPVRLLKISKVLAWQQLRVYEDIVALSGCTELPYAEISDELWSQTAVVSWRWGAGKPASRQGGFTPMTDIQFSQLRKVLTGLKEQGVHYVWLDYCCVPQYSGGAAGTMVEIMRSKMFYARARAMVIIPAYDTVPDDGVTRFVLTKAARLLQDGAHKMAERGQAADAIYGILHRGFIANGSYFCRIWTLVERMARHGRPELLCHWISLEAWLGMVLDAMRRSVPAATAAAAALATSTSVQSGGGRPSVTAASPGSPGAVSSAPSRSSIIGGAGVQEAEDSTAVPQVFKEMLGEEAAKLMDAIGGPWAAAVKTGSIHLAEGLDAKLATLLETATAAWHTSSVLYDSPTKSWLLAYLDDAHLGKYAASSTADRIWAVYSYYCWKHLDHHEPRQVVEALQDLGQVAGASRVVTLRLATKLDLGKFVPADDRDEKLFRAAEVGDVEQVNTAIRAGGNVLMAKPTQDGATPLFMAAQKGHLEVVRALVRGGAGLDAAKTSGCTPLHTAAMNGHTDVVRYLLEAGANKDSQFNDGATPLYVAAEKGKVEPLKLLLEAGADKNAALKKEGHTPLCIAVLNHHTECVWTLVKAGVDINLALKDGATPLYLASEKGFLDCLEVLLEAKANTELGMESGATPMYIASQNNHPECIKVLLKAGANKNAARRDRATPLYIASERGHVDVVNILLEAGANMECTFQSGATPIYVAAQNNRVEVVKALIAKKANKLIKLRGGYTPVHSASLAGHVDVVKALVEAGVDKNLPLDDGATPIYLAAEKGHVELVKYYLSIGADKNKADMTGKRPIDAARKHFNVVELLSEKTSA
ncbi:hypothetical protein PLESTB_001667000 [Pleodorina starrii]|uniref:Heterokaryon incompatibility domain-containing protein n=1 Tax=Pleodorina starrii TaxID=330485 RepID=A0A9W6BZ35_9CHLO|nr:hypothetical protein PLESTM_000627800 [Pleodorina starrii]GLC60753.1 hypothetical protein PLESTB_001667000 [Pleodorina starrii]GLC75470.1 hypothetical protein PLESTF_001641200 [Pleodorina starrii]